MPNSQNPPSPSASVPRHVAIIMDGNGRWAQRQGLPRWEGHRAGVDAVRNTLEAAQALGIEYLTLYSFSSENWKRPTEEINALMELLSFALREEGEKLVEHNIRLRHIGDISALPQSAQQDLQAVLQATAHCDGHTLCLALNYGSRDEITRAVRKLSTDIQSGTLQPDLITQDHIASALDTADLPDPDLLIRTAGEMRLSNFLLWQLAYAELYVTKTLWPDFNADSLKLAVDSYATRDRRFGGLNPPDKPVQTASDR
jgi:undecaprenyl diphosphate synthase